MIRYTVGLSLDLINVPDLNPKTCPEVKVTVLGIVRMCLELGTWFWYTVKSVIGRTISPSLIYTVGLLGYLKMVPEG